MGLTSLPSHPRKTVGRLVVSILKIKEMDNQDGWEHRFWAKFKPYICLIDFQRLKNRLLTSSAIDGDIISPAFVPLCLYIVPWLT